MTPCLEGRCSIQLSYGRRLNLARLGYIVRGTIAKLETHGADFASLRTILHRVIKRLDTGPPRPRQVGKHAFFRFQGVRAD